MEDPTTKPTGLDPDTGGPGPEGDGTSHGPARFDVPRFTRALAFAASAHANQRRKGASQEPYVNHLIEVADLVARATGGDDQDLLIAALLHDVIEDTSVTPEELENAFGARVRSIVEEDSDDMSLPKEERKRRRIELAPRRSVDARIVKTADVISNIRAAADAPPAGWSAEHRLSYLDSARQLIEAGRGANAAIEALFDEEAARAEALIRADRDMGDVSASRHLKPLDEAIGQPVHLVYLPNTRRRDITESDIDQLCAAIALSFPSATIQRADAIYDGARRPILIARIRTDSTDAIVALAQRLCLTFDERFVGVEVGGRYVRVYADDTG